MMIIICLFASSSSCCFCLVIILFWHAQQREEEESQRGAGGEKNENISSTNFQNSEVSKVQWKNYEEGINSIRKYNLEKKSVLTRVNKLLLEYSIV